MQDSEVVSIENGKQQPANSELETPLWVTHNEPHYSAGPRRWWQLFVYSLITTNQTYNWIFYASLPDQTKSLFPAVTNASFFMFLNWGPIMFIPCQPIATWLLYRPNGVKNSLIIASALCAICTLVRYSPVFFSCSNETTLVLLNLGQIINAWAGPLINSLPSKVAADWFPDNERATATAIGSTISNLGTLISLALAFLVTSDDEFRYTILIHAILSSFLCLLTLLTIAQAPAEFPSAVGAAAAYCTVREGCGDISNVNESSSYTALKKMMIEVRVCFRNRSFFLIVVVGGLFTGVGGVWGSIFPVLVGTQGYSTQFGTWLGITCNVGGLIGGLLSGLVCDTIFVRNFKRVSLLYMVLSVIFFIPFTLSFPIPSPFGDWSMLQSIMGGDIMVVTMVAGIGFCLTGFTPPALELAAELTYPTPEGTSAGIYFFVQNASSFGLLFCLMNIDPIWSNSIMLGTCIVCCILLLFVVEEHARFLAGKLVT